MGAGLCPSACWARGLWAGIRLPFAYPVGCARAGCRVQSCSQLSSGEQAVDTLNQDYAVGLRTGEKGPYPCCPRWQPAAPCGYCAFETWVGQLRHWICTEIVVKYIHKCTFLSIRFCGFKNIHIGLHPSAPSISRTFFIIPNGNSVIIKQQLPIFPSLSSLAPHLSTFCLSEVDHSLCCLYKWTHATFVLWWLAHFHRHDVFCVAASETQNSVSFNFH